MAFLEKLEVSFIYNTEALSFAKMRKIMPNNGKRIPGIRLFFTPCRLGMIHVRQQPFEIHRFSISKSLGIAFAYQD
ncbi:MAG: hypothetical protein JW836_05605 [Deltaproteobacteria bacterium]|nr:hypothetical protein [Deltaproteobacteria bacterium]